MGLGLVYLIFLYTDIRRYLNRIKARQAFLLAPADGAYPLRFVVYRRPLKSDGLKNQSINE